MSKRSVLKVIKTRLLGSRDRVRLTGRHYDHARQLLLYTVDLLNAKQIPYHVVYGSLLGLVRDGDLIPWDVDVDIMIPRTAVGQFRQTLKDYRRHGWRVCDRYPLTYEYAAWDRGDVSSIMIKRPLLSDFFRAPYFRTGRKIMDVYVRYPDGDAYAWDTFEMVSRAAKRFFAGHEVIEYAGRQVHVPCHYREFLELIYGNWRTPNPNYDAKRNDGSLVRDARWHGMMESEQRAA